MGSLNKVSTSTRTALVESSSDGIVTVRILESAEQSLEDAKENVAAAVAAGSGRCVLLVDIRYARPLTPKTRHYYTGKTLTDHFVALGLLVKATSFGRMMGNVYLRIANPGIPAMLFASEEEALTWLRERRNF